VRFRRLRRPARPNESENPASEASDHDESEHAHGEGADHDESEHAHGEGADHADHDDHDAEEGERLALNDQALANIGIAAGDAGTLVLQPSEYRKSFSFPGYVRYKRGRSLVGVPAPASGVVTEIYVDEGVALRPGQPLFELRLVGDELTAAQLELTALLRKRDRLESEEKRLANLEAGVAPREQREIALEKAENEAAIATQCNALLLFGLPEATIDEVVVQKRELVSTLTVCAPKFSDAATDAPSNAGSSEVSYCQALEKTFVEKGKSVSIGAPICVVSDLRELLIEGRAFESDEPLVNAALAEGRPVSAIFAPAEAAAPDAPREKVGPLVFRSISNRIDANSRAFTCYVELKNYLLDSAPRPKNDAVSTSSAVAGSTNATSETAEVSDESAPRLNWRFKPGQRCELAVETETLQNVFVVPVAATAQEGAETFLFEQDGNEDGKRVWRKRSVRVLHQTADEVVVANDGSLEPGAKIANRGAYQLYVALTNGGGKLQSSHGHEH